MRLPFTLARRELRGHQRGSRLFLACLAVGVAAMAGVGSFSASVTEGLRRDSRSLLGGDVDLSLHNLPAPTDHVARLRSRAAGLSRVVELRAMARASSGDGLSMVELKAVDAAYPLVGAVTLDPPRALDEVLATQDRLHGAAVDPNLLAKLGIGLGGRLIIGVATFEVRAAVLKEPDRVASVFSFGPRVLVSEDALRATGLIQPGSQAHYHYRIALPSGVAAADWIGELKAMFPDAAWRIRGVGQAAEGIQRFIERMTLFLSFVGFAILLIGGIGVANAVKSYLDGKIGTIAILKCLGAESGLVLRAYFLQVAALGSAAIVIGVTLGAILPTAVLALIGDRLPVPPQLGIYVGPLALAGLFGALTAYTFAIWPLAVTRNVRPASLFRARVAPAGKRPQAGFIWAAALGAAALSLLTVMSASDRAFAAWFLAGAGLTLLILRIAAAVVMAAAARLRHLRGAGLRLAFANLHRPGSVVSAVMVSLGTGLSVLTAVVLIEGNLAREIDERLPATTPAFFFIDIQPDQAEAFDRAIRSVPGATGLQRVPTLRGRIVRINGVPVEQAKIDPDSAWAVRGDRALTFAERPREGARMVAGEWWPPAYAGPPLISLDAGIARGFRVGVGDTLAFNVLGREITARIANLREIDWRSLRFDFAVIFAPGTLDGAPHAHIAAVEAPPDAENAIERAVADRFANVTAIRVREALEAASRVLAGVAWAVRGTAAIAILAGALVLAGAISAGHRRRVYDAVVFKVLGATRGRVLKVFLIEYGVLGIATAAIGAATGTLTGWAVTRFLMKSSWTFLPGTAVATAIACLAVTLVVGFAGTWRALGERVAPRLRND